ncbi:MAG: GvpL/GvpF family gas vesicle protein [Nitrospirae bacterium]|nr:GvpL/GvpF family gas vesicle protein [Nitrospirota bacterium]
MADLIYLYCVTNRVPQPKDDGYGVYSLNHQGLYAVVSKVPEDEFGEENLKKNLSNLEWLKIKAYRHEKIVEEVMKDGCVVPFKLATLFTAEDSLMAMLKEHAEELRRNLENLEEKDEWGVKIYCDMERLKNIFLIDDKEILRMDKEISSSALGPGKAFLLKKKREKLLNDLIDKKIEETVQEFLNGLKQQSLRTRFNRSLPKDVTERMDDMILNAAFLVEQDKLNAFIREIEILKNQYEGTGFLFDCTGPWPPYNFC